MSSKVYSAAVVGFDAFEVEIEVHAGWGNRDKIAVVGLPDTAVKESKDRVTSAICNAQIALTFEMRPRTHASHRK
jgi:magnesium chelatase family protein